MRAFCTQIFYCFKHVKNTKKNPHRFFGMVNIIIKKQFLENDIVHERETNMKKWRKVILAILCVGVIVGTTACGNRNGAEGDDAANNTQTEQNDTNNNDVTEGTDKNKDNNGGVVDDMGNAAGNVIDDIGNGVENITDDMTGNDNNRTNDTTGNNNNATNDANR